MPDEMEQETPQETAEETAAEATGEATEEAPQVEEPQIPEWKTAMDEQMKETVAGLQRWMGGVLGNQMTKLKSELSEMYQKPEEEDPYDQDQKKAFMKWQHESEQQKQNYFKSALSAAGNYMDTEPLFSGNTGKELATEVIDEIKGNIGSLDMKTDPNRAGEFLVKDAINSVLRKKMMSGKTAFDGRQPTQHKTGTTQSKQTQGTKPKVPKLDDAARKFAKKFDYTDEQLAELFKDAV